MTYLEERFMNHEYLKKMINGPRWIGDGPFVQYLFKFENGYGASVIKGQGTYGYDSDLWELAVITWDLEDEWDITYGTEITYDILGFLSTEDVLNTLNDIKNL